MTSYKIFEEIVEKLGETDAIDHGVRMRVANFFFDTPLEARPDQLEKWQEISNLSHTVRIPSLNYPYLQNVLVL